MGAGVPTSIGTGVVGHLLVHRSKSPIMIWTCSRKPAGGDSSWFSSLDSKRGWRDRRVQILGLVARECLHEEPRRNVDSEVRAFIAVTSA